MILKKNSDFFNNYPRIPGDWEKVMINPTKAMDVDKERYLS